MRTISIPGIQCRIKKCPICGKKLILVDTINYFTLICKKCHTTVFEEFDGTLHKIKRGKMKDGYDASLDIFIKSLMSDTMNTCKMSPDKKKEYYMEKLFEGEVLDYGIYQPDIFNFFTINEQILKFAQNYPTNFKTASSDAPFFINWCRLPIRSVLT